MNPIERRIPENVGGTETLFDEAPLIGTVEFNDGLVAFGPALAILFISQNILPASLSGVSLTLSGLSALFGIALLFIKPAYLTLTEWAKNIWSFNRREKDLTYHLVTDGGKPIETLDLAPDDDTRRATGIRNLHPHHDAVERTDGTVVSAVRFTGANMDTADQSEWNMSVAQFANFANTQLRHPVQLFLPMRKFDPTKQIRMYGQRLNDEDVNRNILLKNYVQDRIGWMGTVAANAYVREYYAVVSVSRRDVYDSTVDDEGGLGALNALPGGKYIKDFLVGLGVAGGAAKAMSKREVQAKQLRELERRRSELSKAMAVGTNNTGHVVTANDLGVLLKEFWEGATVHEEEGDGLIRERPFVVGEYDRQQAAEMLEQADTDAVDE